MTTISPQMDDKERASWKHHALALTLLAAAKLEGDTSNCLSAEEALTPDERELIQFESRAKGILSQSKAPEDKLLDVEKLLQEHPQYHVDHVFHETLNAWDKIACPYVLHQTRINEDGSKGTSVKAVVRFGSATRGHPRLVHGGIISLTFDNLLGWLMFINEITMIFTANLRVDFVSPLPCNTVVVVEVRTERVEGRKHFLSGSITSVDGALTFAKCESLFVVPKDTSLFDVFIKSATK